MPSLDSLIKNAHPNSAFRRMHPNGCTTADLPNWDADRSDVDAEYSPERHDYLDVIYGDDWGWDNPELIAA